MTTNQREQPVCGTCGDPVAWFWPTGGWLHNDLKTRDHFATPEPVGEQCQFHDWQVATVYSDAKSMEPTGVWLRCSRCPELCWVSQHDKPSERSLSAEERRQVGKLLEYEKYNYDLLQAAIAANAALATGDGEARRLLERAAERLSPRCNIAAEKWEKTFWFCQTCTAVTYNRDKAGTDIKHNPDCLYAAILVRAHD